MLIDIARWGLAVACRYPDTRGISHYLEVGFYSYDNNFVVPSWVKIVRKNETSLNERVVSCHKVEQTNTDFVFVVM